MVVQWLPLLPQSKSGFDFDSGLSMYGFHILPVLCKFSQGTLTPSTYNTWMSDIL